MAVLYVIEQRDAKGVGLARSGLSLADAERLKPQFDRMYPEFTHSIQPQRMEGRGKSRRVVYPTP